MINFRTPAQVVKVLALAAFIIAAAQVTASAEEWKDCEMFNFTDRTVTQVYMCAADVDINQYGKNMLEDRQLLKNGEGIAVQYPAESATTISESFSTTATSSIGKTSIAPTCAG